MNLASSGLPGGPLGGLLGRLGSLLGALEASWAVLESSWSHLGRLGAILAALEANLEAIGGHLGRLGGHLGPSWGNKGIDILMLASFRVAGGTGRRPRGSSFGKEPKPNPKGSSTPGTPVINQQWAADLMAFGPSRHRAWAACRGCEGLSFLIVKIHGHASAPADPEPGGCCFSGSLEKSWRSGEMRVEEE